MQKTRKRPRLSSEADSTTPACNQCRSRKIRCDRKQPECSACCKAGVPCDFSASFKRTNPARQLLHDFSSVLSRLDHVDRTLARLSEQVKSLTANCIVTTEPLPLPTTKDRNAPEMDTEEGPDDMASKQDLLTVGCGERLYSYPAALCLFRASQKLLRAALHTEPPSLHGPLAAGVGIPALRPSLLRHYEMFPFRQGCTEPPITSDQRPITPPPQDVLYSVLDRYLNHINLHTPVFEAGVLYGIIPECYRSNGPSDHRAWLVCLNSIVLLTLHLDARVARRSGLDIDPWRKHSEVISDALNNCRRALAELDALSQPTMVNIQALIMLALVTREFFINAVFEKVCSAACKIARSIGLHRCVGTVNDSALQARQRLFWILYAMDKTRVFLSGHSPDLYLFDSEFQPLPSTPLMPVEMQLKSTAAHMMAVWEEIYIGLYSARAVFLGAEHRREQLHRLNRLCDERLPSHPSLVSRDPGLRLMQLEIKYCYHVSKILIHRCHRTAEEWQITREHAVSALKIITDVFEEPVTPGSCMVLGRMFQNYPLVAFHDLCARFLTGEGAVDLAGIVPQLISVRRQLSSLENKDIPNAYVTKLHLGVAWCTELMSMITDSSEALEPTPCLLTPSTITDVGDFRPSGSVGHESATYLPGTNNTLTREQADISETFDSPDYFFDPALLEVLLSEGHFAT
ncbi:hypothetical protein N7513_002530 [Penicillium frequentans]|nr:hypothetical protein N7513_002530 [Penicillium glabrum]